MSCYARAARRRTPRAAATSLRARGPSRPFARTRKRCYLNHILAEFDSQRLARQVDALGSITVEATSKALNALAASEHVKAIIEDQPVKLLAGQRG